MTQSSSHLIRQLEQMIRTAGARPAMWVTTAIGVSVFLALLDMLGVAALVPLTNLISGERLSGPLLSGIPTLFGTDNPARLIPVVAALVALLFIGKSILALLFRWWLYGRTTRIAAALSTKLMSHYTLAPFAYHRSRDSAEVYRNIYASTIQATSVLMAIVSLSTDLVMVLGIGVILTIASPIVMPAVVLLFALLILLLQASLRRRQTRIGEQLAESSHEAWRSLMPAVDGFRDARLTSSGSMFIRAFERSRYKEARAMREMGFLSEVPRYMLEMAFIVSILAISAYFYISEQGADALSILSLFAAASVRTLPSLTRVSVSLGTVRQGRVGLAIVLDAFDELNEQGQHDESPSSTLPFKGDIRLDSVSFQYGDAADAVLKKISLTIKENTTTAFVGSSGAGKSTLLELVLGLLQPTSGSIFSGKRPTSSDLAGWYSTLGVVPQDVFLMNASVMENIAFGVESSQIDEALVTEVVAKCQLDDVVAELPNGLGTVVGERGVRLSGGQRQRLGLARALYRRPSVLILDEATSALDNATERQITSALDELKGKLTVIIVAHRLSSVQSADRIVYLEHGEIAGFGTFAELRSTSSGFAHLVALGELR